MLTQVIREGKPEETDIKLPEFARLVFCAVIEEDGIKGHIFISEVFGKVFAHDLKHWGTDKTAVKRLTRFWQQQVKGLGVDVVYGEYTDQRQRDIALANGWKLESVILKKEL